MHRQRGNNHNREIIAISVLLFIFFWMLVGIYYYPPLKKFDYTVNNYLKSIHSQFLTAFMIFITDLGAWGVAFAGTVAAVALAMKRKWYLLTVWICAHLGAVALNETIKAIIGRPRPPLPHLVHVTTFSYPSGHALVSMAAYGLMSYYLTLWSCTKTFKPLFITLWIILFTSIGFSRMYLQVHYFSDVIAGYSIGAAWLIVCVAWVKKATN
jgi:undecaprenyl-diphosphatase